ncbi:GNAT family N-acetyltransferase [Paenibacillus donghaensis]|uniref:GNAT family N-acetyltransferase n=2 Tax=Paenibacillus donghaensis TaxID=414771 RepID=A0A2Z2K6A6_9BACL|nr:GNAT family protein [Paenibacillus donghaensis]ASA21716.1 GNAT family N-acetyltransferase [Paenibacillus donghaensis]
MLEQAKVVIRELTVEDAPKLTALREQLDRETSFMLMEPGERQVTLKQVEDMLDSYDGSDNSLMIGAEAEGRLTGYLSVQGGKARRNRHSAHIVVGILQEAQGIGIGSAFFERMDTWAVAQGIVRLELTVMAHNERALRLYQKSGFEIEGTKRKSLRVDGRWVDEYYMGKLLPEQEPEQESPTSH